MLYQVYIGLIKYNQVSWCIAHCWCLFTWNLIGKTKRLSEGKRRNEKGTVFTSKPVLRGNLVHFYRPAGRESQGINMYLLYKYWDFSTIYYYNSIHAGNFTYSLE